MVDTRDLRLGNLVYGVSDRIEEVIGLAEGVVTTTLVKLREATFICEQDDVNGIELNEEWLIRLGFRKVGGSYFMGCIEVFLSDKGINVSLEFDSTVTGSYSREVDIEFVHQIQNLVYALDKEELILKDL